MGVFDIFSQRTPSVDPIELQRIADVAGQRDLRALVELLQFLPPPSSPYGPAAAQAVNTIVDAASPEEVAAFDQWYREPAYTGPRTLARPSWEAIQIGPLESWTRQFPATVAIATCHRNGFVREKAVEVLVERQDGAELPFLLVRLNDWVPQVRFVAAKGVRARLHAPYASHWVRCLGLLEHIQRGGRTDQAWLRAPVDALLQREDTRDALEAGLVHGTRGVRRECVRIAAGLGDPTHVLALALRDADPIASARAATVLCASLDGDALREVISVMQRGNSKARCLALNTWCERLPRDAESQLRAAFLDHATSVRELARFRWKKLGLFHIDFGTFYRHELETQTGDLFTAALRGLAETGTVDDVPVFLKYVDHPRGRVREAAILGLGRCDGANQVPALVKALGDSNLQVAKAARRYSRLYLGRGAVPKIARSMKKERLTARSDDAADGLPDVPWLRR